MELEMNERLETLEKKMEVIEDPDQQRIFKELVAQVTGITFGSL